MIDQRYTYLFFFLALGFLMIIYGLGLRTFNIIEFLGYFLMIVSVTIILIGSTTKDLLYYLIWGITLFFIGIYILSYFFINSFLIIGIYLIVISILIFFIYRKK
jgi:hypothetical protein